VKATNAVRLKVASIVVRGAITSSADDNCNETPALCQPPIGSVSTACPPFVRLLRGTCSPLHRLPVSYAFDEAPSVRVSSVMAIGVAVRCDKSIL
jgi:hypothetical protein